MNRTVAPRSPHADCDRLNGASWHGAWISSLAERRPTARWTRDAEREILRLSEADGKLHARGTRVRERTIEFPLSDRERIASYKQGAIDYARNLPDWAREELYRKPFFTFKAIPEQVSLVYLRDLANLVELAALPGGASILDVACGPGWLSESLYRFGYRVTGVDIAEDLLAVARERIRTLPYRPIDRDSTWIEFRCLDVETERMERRFDAVVLYDCLHHFVDAASALENIRSMLSPLGLLVIKEGEMPTPGSEAERELLAESHTFNTLEAPFRPEALQELLAGAGFRDVRRMLPAASLVPAGESMRGRLRRAFGAPPGPPANFFVARLAPARRAESGDALAHWSAEITLLGVEPGEDAYTVRVGNRGSLVWTAGSDEQPGTVCLGCRLFSAAGEKLDEYGGRTPLPRDLAPGDEAELTLRYPRPEGLTAGGRLTVDLISRGSFWFGDQGSPVLDLELPARR